jgi:hypothetical protein
VDFDGLYLSSEHLQLLEQHEMNGPDDLEVFAVGLLLENHLQELKADFLHLKRHLEL